MYGQGGDAVGVDVIVVSHRTPDGLVRFVNSFAEVQWEVPSTLHIVNVEPEATDIEACYEIASSGVVEVPSTYSATVRDIGWARSCNAVARSLLDVGAARSTVACFTTDVQLTHGVLDECHWQLSLHPELAAIAPKQVSPSGQILHGGVFDSGFSPRGAGEPDGGQYDEIRLDAVALPSTAHLFRRVAWDELAGCPTFQAATRAANLDAYGPLLPTEEGASEFSALHARKHGWQIGYNGEVAVIRDGDPTEGLIFPGEVFRAACYAHDIAH